MQISVKKMMIFILCVLLTGIAFVGFLYFNNDIGVQKSQLETDIRSGQKISSDWNIDGAVSDTIAAFISYPRDMNDHTFSVYVNRPGLSFGYFFRGGGDLTVKDTDIVEYTVDGYKERAFMSMNKQQVERLEIDDGNSIQVIDIDSSKPFSLVLPVNAGYIAFYDVDGNTVGFQKHML
ncbi:MAG: hypothetical protein HDT43_13515 [Ruminococcaceae bacterium]|nr:hypothetical protein [Oscillospiraceae bacterium]